MNQFALISIQKYTKVQRDVVLVEKKTLEDLKIRAKGNFLLECFSFV